MSIKKKIIIIGNVKSGKTFHVWIMFDKYLKLIGFNKEERTRIIHKLYFGESEGNYDF